MLKYDLGKRSGFKVPRTNIGAMRLPKDTDEAVALIRHAIDSGMKYIDTSRGYGDSEIKLGKALKDGYREKVILSTKWAPWIMKVEETDDYSADSVRRRIEESMKRLDVDYLDYYQIWNIDNRDNYTKATAKGGMLDGIKKAKKDGLIGHIGFTTHDTVENLLSYLPEIDWCQIVLFTYNLLSTTYAPAIEAYHKAGIGTIIMNPVGGGLLSGNSEVLMPLARRVGATSVPDLAIRYLMSNPNVDIIISGISKKQDVDDSIASANRKPFTRDEMRLIEELQKKTIEIKAEFCTRCGYCKPCPEGIDIPTVMSCIADERFWGLREPAVARYNRMKEAKADACTQCGQCESKCTQKLKIIDEMMYAKKSFGN